MFPQIAHDSGFRYPSFRRCSLVTQLAGTYLSDIKDRNALQDSHCNAGQCHMHFYGAHSFQYFFCGTFPLPHISGATVPLSSCNNSVLACALTRNNNRMHQSAVSVPGKCIRSENDNCKAG